jgi:hypothetical protein
MSSYLIANHFVDPPIDTIIMLSLLVYCVTLLSHSLSAAIAGLLMHEMISARHPFHGASHYDTLRNMVTKPPTIDARLSAPAAMAVKMMLVKNPRARLCCREGSIRSNNSIFYPVCKSIVLDSSSIVEKLMLR